MLALSVLLVAGTLAVVFAHAGVGSELRFGHEQMIHARIPWLLVLPLWAGAALGVAAVVRGFRAWKLAVVLLELPLVALVSWYFLAGSFLPEHPLRVAVGDPFPAYALQDHEGVLREVEPAVAGEAALYVFYRGDW